MPTTGLVCWALVWWTGVDPGGEAAAYLESPPLIPAASRPTRTATTDRRKMVGASAEEGPAGEEGASAEESGPADDG